MPASEMEVTGASQPDVEMEVTSASQPGVEMEVTGASQPDASSSVAAARGSDAPAPQPGMSPSNISPIVTEVLEFGRIPVEIKHPRTKEEREESALAQGLRKKKKYLTDLDRLQLAALTEDSKEKKKADREKTKEMIRASELMREVRQLGHYPDRYVPAEYGLQQRLTRARSAVLFQPADEAELQELQWQAQREKEEDNLQVDARVAEADTDLKAMHKAMQDKYPTFFGDATPKLGDPMYGTIEWLQLLSKKDGGKDVLKVLCEWEGVDKKSLGKAATAQHMIKEIVKKRVDVAERKLLRTTVAEQIKQAIDATTGETPSFATPTIQLLSKYIKDDARNSKLASVRREVIKALTEMTEEAEKEGLDLRPYNGALACSLFLYFGCSGDGDFSNAEKVAQIASIPIPEVFMNWVVTSMLCRLATFIDDIDAMMAMDSDAFIDAMESALHRGVSATSRVVIGKWVSASSMTWRETREICVPCRMQGRC